MGYRYKCAIRLMANFCCLLFMFSWTAFGQDPIVIPSSTGEGNFDLITSQIRLLKKELDESDLNRITLQQMGDMNRAFITQHSQNHPNLIKVYQGGNENYSSLTQSGNNNASDIKQRGDGNSYEGTHTGNHIINSVVQGGYGNNIEQTLEGNMLNFQINQYGIGHELIQIETIMDGIGYKVTQRGLTGMKIKIEQGNIYK